MPLSLTTRHKQQTLSNKWSIQQHPDPRLTTDESATNTNVFRLHQHHSNSLNQAVRKQTTIKKTLNLNKKHLTTNSERAYLSRGLLLERSHDKKRSSYSKQVLKKHSSITTQYCNGKNDQETLKTGDLLKRNITSSKQRDSGAEFLRNTRKIQAWSSTTSILKTLDKELAQLNGVVGKCKAGDVKASYDIVDNVNPNEPKSDSASQSDTPNSELSCKQAQTEVNKVNLSIVLSHTLNSAKEENYLGLSDQEVDEEDGVYTSSDSSKIVISYPKQKDNKKTESTSNSFRTTKSIVSAQQRRALFQTSKLATNLAFNSNNNSATALNSGIQNPQNFNDPSSATIKRRPPLVRAMSAPVRSFEETTKVSNTFLNTKRKSRGKADIKRNVLTRSKSVAPDVVTLVSLINSEESDSEKDDKPLIPSNSHTPSPNKRAPCLRKTGKSVSFQENYPPTFQFASKEYSHMLRRGIAPLAQRITLNRPPTAPPGSIYHITQKVGNEIPDANIESNKEMENKEKESNLDDIKTNMSNTLSETMTDKAQQEEFKFPEYVCSLKERECWKLFMKMSTKGVIITYDTISRGMLTPTEYRQLQKQRKTEEAKALKEAEEKCVLEDITKKPPSGLERLKESLLKN